MSNRDGSAVIVFDGVCVLCNGWVRFLLRRDHARKYRFAAMQGPSGKALLRRHGIDPENPSSFLLLDVAGAWTDTHAILRVLAELGGPWRLLSRALALAPRAWRDRAYAALARNRYRWFGRRPHCAVPSPEDLGRFLD